MLSGSLKLAHSWSVAGCAAWLTWVPGRSTLAGDEGCLVADRSRLAYTSTLPGAHGYLAPMLLQPVHVTTPARSRWMLPDGCAGTP